MPEARVLSALDDVRPTFRALRTRRPLWCLVRARSRDVLLPVLLYPITVPVIIAGVRGTMAIAQPDFDVEVVRFWLLLLVAFDVVFITLALWTFEPVMTD